MSGQIYYHISIEGILKQIEEPTYCFRFFNENMSIDINEEFDNSIDCLKLLYQNLALYGSSNEKWTALIEKFFWVENEIGERDLECSEIELILYSTNQKQKIKKAGLLNV
jgi:hypothetical protein